MIGVDWKCSWRLHRVDLLDRPVHVKSYDAVKLYNLYNVDNKVNCERWLYHLEQERSIGAPTFGLILGHRRPTLNQRRGWD